nr:GNAT family N-acetyltransferase [Variovorax sp. dw_954]
MLLTKRRRTSVTAMLVTIEQQRARRRRRGEHVFTGQPSLAVGGFHHDQGSLHVEAAFSVDTAWRGRGWGTRLMEAVQAQARAAGVQRVLGMCAVRNLPMRHVFERAVMQLIREDDEMHAHRELPSFSVAA